jgi:hypothetical protein
MHCMPFRISLTGFFSILIHVGAHLVHSPGTQVVTLTYATVAETACLPRELKISSTAARSADTAPRFIIIMCENQTQAEAEAETEKSITSYEPQAFHSLSLQHFDTRFKFSF